MKISILKGYLNQIKDVFLLNRNFYNRFFFPSPSLKRDEFIINWILNLPKQSNLLDAGAGIQRYKKYAKHLNYTSQDFGKYEGGEDFSGDKVKSWESKSCNIISDITNIPIDNETFDFILCSEVIEHLIDPFEALKELNRVLKNKGKILITAPFRSLYHQSPYFYYSGFSKFWFIEKAKELNLEISGIVPNGNYLSDLAFEVIRTTYFGPLIFRYLTRLVSLPYLLLIYIFNKYMKIITPESCTGYYVVLKKNI